jgi:hypothetical protein
MSLSHLQPKVFIFCIRKPMDCRKYLTPTLEINATIQYPVLVPKLADIFLVFEFGLL